MKKYFLAALFACACSLTSCISVVEGVSQEEYDELQEKYDKVVAQRDALLRGETIVIDEEEEAETVAPGKFNEEEVVSQLSVEEYAYSNDFWNYSFLVIKNNSEYTLSISADVKFYNESGELIGVDQSEERPVASGSEICLYSMPDEKYAAMEYELNVEEDTWYESVVRDLSYESVPAKNKEIVSVTNNSDKVAEFVKVYALFFNGNEPVGFANDYFTDDDGELNPEKTISRELSCYEDYTSVRYFITGRRR